MSVLYAYNIEKMESLCAEVFSGHSIDVSVYSVFIRDNDIKNDIFATDKGFPPSKIKDELKERPDLHFLTLIKRNGVLIFDNNTLFFESVLKGVGEHIVYKMKQIREGRFLYVYIMHETQPEGGLLSCQAMKKILFLLKNTRLRKIVLV